MSDDESGYLRRERTLRTLDEIGRVRSAEDGQVGAMNRPLTQWLATITDALGEIARAIILYNTIEGRKALVRTAACCVAAIEDCYPDIGGMR